MKLSSFLCTCLIVAASPLAVSANERTAAQGVIDVGRAGSEVMDHLDTLVNQIGARLTASHAEKRACDWAVETFRSYGLDANIEIAGEFAVGFERGPWSGKMTVPEEMILEFGTPAWSAGTRGLVTADVVRAPKDVENAVAADYEGRWVLMPTQQRRRSRAQRESSRAVRSFLNEAKPAGFIQSTRDKYIRTGGSPRIKWEKLPTIPRINLRRDQFDHIAELVDGDQAVTLQFDIRNHFRKGPVPYRNVIADLKGSELPDEYVIIGAHIDSWDGATGTVDNGLGCAVAIEAARILSEAGARPKRTIRFCLWSGEEQGLLGSKAYIEAHPEILDKISGVFVYDGGPNVITSVDSSEAMYDDMMKAFGPCFDLSEEFPFTINKRAGLPVGVGSDHDAFLRKNVPGFFWTQKGRADFRHGLHTQFDTYDLAIPEYAAHSSLIVALGSLGVANLDNLLSREKLKSSSGRRMGVFLEGVAITNVIPDSVAAKAGLQPGDVFATVEGKPVKDRTELVAAIRKGGPKKEITVTRGGKSIKAVLEWPGEKPQKPKKKRAVAL
ncbi:MAG: M20/M25/M40 family metallo-hydrolase [Planctomycetota bacterium]